MPNIVLLFRRFYNLTFMVLNAGWHDIFSSKEYAVSMIVEIMNGEIKKAKKLRNLRESQMEFLVMCKEDL